MIKKYDEILNFYREYIKLEQVIRKGWIMCNVPAKRLESVADHTLQLIMLSSIIVRKLNLDIDLVKLTNMLLVHDLGEIVIGDISEVEIDRDLKKIEESSAVKSLLDNLDDENSKYYYDLWIEMESKNTEVSKFAYLLDKIDAVIKARIYEEEYNLDGLLEEFSEFRKQHNTFDGSILEELFNYVSLKV